MIVRELMEELRRIDPEAKVVRFDIRLATHRNSESELRTWVWKDNGPDLSGIPFGPKVCTHGVPVDQHCEECGKVFKHNADSGALKKTLEDMNLIASAGLLNGLSGRERVGHD